MTTPIMTAETETIPERTDEMSDTEATYDMSASEVDRILSMSDAEVIAEVIARGDDPKVLADHMRELFERSVARKHKDYRNENDEVIRVVITE